MKDNMIRERTDYRIRRRGLPALLRSLPASGGAKGDQGFSGDSEKGFTLIELMVVVIILGILAALVVPKMVGREKEAKQKAAFIQIELLGTALDYFALQVGRYPTTSEGLKALVEKPSGVENWKGPYLKKIEIPRDSWHNDYHYESPGKYGDYDLYSYGADNAEGGEGNDQDIVSWRGLK
jgi:general secretion pathway protein G